MALAKTGIEARLNYNIINAKGTVYRPRMAIFTQQYIKRITSIFMSLIECAMIGQFIECDTLPRGSLDYMMRRFHIGFKINILPSHFRGQQLSKLRLLVLTVQFMARVQKLTR